MIDSLFKVLASGLSLWESKESRKYIDKLIFLKKEYYEESNKPIPDDAVLDNIRFELYVLSEAFSSKIGESNSKNK